MSDTLESMLQVPFTDEVKSRQGRGGLTFDYIDARTAMARMDDVLGLKGWEFHVKHIVGSVVVGSLTVHTADGPRTHEDVGYPNGPDDEEPLKSAASDALKRCAVHIGVGRHLYLDSSPRPTPATGTSSSQSSGPRAPQSDGSWECPEHGSERIGSGRNGLYCQVRGGSNTNAKGYCNHNEQNTRQVEARPRPVAVPDEPDDLYDSTQLGF